jgi:hypothetical protein
MMLIDSNIIIYAAQPGHEDLRRFVLDRVPAISAVSCIEVLGYHRLTKQERQYFDAFFKASLVLPLSQKDDLRRCAGSRYSLGVQSHIGHTEHKRLQRD